MHEARIATMASVGQAGPLENFKVQEDEGLCGG